MKFPIYGKIKNVPNHQPESFPVVEQIEAGLQNKKSAD